MPFVYKGLSDKRFKTIEVIQRAVVLPETALLLGKETFRLKGPHEASVGHCLHRFAHTAA